MTRYRHTQIGYLICASVGGAMILIAILVPLREHNLIPAVVLLILAICLLLFASLIVEIDEENIHIRFGPGLVRKTFPLREIESYRAVRNRWYYGWGIRSLPGGWLYNVSGLDAVELVLRNGKKYRIGTDDPKGLTEAIQQVLGQQPG